MAAAEPRVIEGSDYTLGVSDDGGQSWGALPGEPAGCLLPEPDSFDIFVPCDRGFPRGTFVWKDISDGFPELGVGRGARLEMYYEVQPGRAAHLSVQGIITDYVCTGDDGALRVEVEMDHLLGHLLYHSPLQMAPNRLIELRPARKTPARE
jgi:hypothetical protein